MCHLPRFGRKCFLPGREAHERRSLSLKIPSIQLIRGTRKRESVSWQEEERKRKRKRMRGRETVTAGDVEGSIISGHLMRLLRIFLIICDDVILSSLCHRFQEYLQRICRVHSPPSPSRCPHNDTQQSTHTPSQSITISLSSLSHTVAPHSLLSYREHQQKTS